MIESKCSTVSLIHTNSNRGHGGNKEQAAKDNGYDIYSPMV